MLQVSQDKDTNIGTQPGEGADEGEKPGDCRTRRSAPIPAPRGRDPPASYAETARAASAPARNQSPTYVTTSVSATARTAACAEHTCRCPHRIPTVSIALCPPTPQQDTWCRVPHIQSRVRYCPRTVAATPAQATRSTAHSIGIANTVWTIYIHVQYRIPTPKSDFSTGNTGCA